MNTPSIQVDAAARDRLAEWLLYLPIVGVTFLSKIAFPVGGTQVSVGIPILLAAVAGGLLLGRLRIHAGRLALYLGLVAVLLLLQVVRQGDPQKMLQLVEKITSQGATREQLRKNAETEKPKPGRPKAFVFAFKPATKAFNLRLQFNKRNSSKDEVISALEEIIRELKKAK